MSGDVCVMDRTSENAYKFSQELRESDHLGDQTQAGSTY